MDLITAVEGNRAEIATTGWWGEHFRDRVIFLADLRLGRWSLIGLVGGGMCNRERRAHLFGLRASPELERQTVKGLENNSIQPIKAPWKSGQTFKAGGMDYYYMMIGEFAATIALATAAGLGWLSWATVAAAALFVAGKTLILSQTDSGWGLPGFHYDEGSHKGFQKFAIDFTKYAKGIPYKSDAAGQPVLAVQYGVVGARVADCPTGKLSCWGNHVQLRHPSWTKNELYGEVISALAMIVFGVDPKFGSKVMSALKYTSDYVHLDGPGKVPVDVGQWVEMGQFLGPCDDTGNSAVNHIHFHMNEVKAVGGLAAEEFQVKGMSTSYSTPAGKWLNGQFHNTFETVVEGKLLDRDGGLMDPVMPTPMEGGSVGDGQQIKSTNTMVG
jgi:murein DD-endopeptidase MepM/ murein hydrolase activator NlpD